MSEKIRVLLDTDIGSDIDDAVALVYLLAQPRCELFGVTTVRGSSDRRAMLAGAARGPRADVLCTLYDDRGVER